MKILSIVGARPQFIKAAVVSRLLRKDHNEILVHTGQHYDNNMSDIFFSELSMPEPDYNLGIGSGHQGEQTAAMLSGIENVLIKERPQTVLVYGDTNSTLAGALAAVKLHIPIAHVEAGLRSFNRVMPEEINRILTDHVSTLLFCPSQTAIDNLANEGIKHGVHLVGDVMFDVQLWALAQEPLKVQAIFRRNNIKPKEYLLLTVHRAENTDDPNRLETIFKTINALEENIIWPIHPRTRRKIEEMDYQFRDHVHIIEPIGYLDMVHLEANARKILTDSGGIQKEAYWLKVPCITLRDETEWVETVEAGWNILVGASTQAITQAISHWNPAEDHPNIYGDGNAAEKIIQLIAHS